MKIIWCMIPEIWSTTERIYSHFGPFFALLHPLSPLITQNPENQNFEKMKKKNNWKYHHFTQVYHKWQPYDTWFLKYEVHQTEFFCNFLFWAMFCLVTLLTAQKIKISKKGKKHLEISPFYTCVPKIMIRWFMVHEIWYVTDR